MDSAIEADDSKLSFSHAADQLQSSETMLPVGPAAAGNLMTLSPEDLRAVEAVWAQRGTSSSSSSDGSFDPSEGLHASTEGRFSEAEKRTERFESSVTASTRSPTSPSPYYRHVDHQLAEQFLGARRIQVQREPTQALRDVQDLLESRWPTQTCWMSESCLTATVFIEFVAVEVQVQVIDSASPDLCTLSFREIGQSNVVFFSRLCTCATSKSGTAVDEDGFADDDSMDLGAPGQEYMDHWWADLLAAKSTTLRRELLQTLATWTELSADCASAVAQNLTQDELSRLLSSPHLAELYPMSVILRNAASSANASIMAATVMGTISSVIAMLPPSIASQELHKVVELLSAQSHGMSSCVVEEVS
eukprot:CAMPEP_0197625608 /NCGR_PEP_ID=MMETSP1338-20131121/4927_1 /TAXON_ID=43686 ORGANISM="Pelagodinium beii, Strain RCC1491" /NCGR_SAMPLE_ID=MMETSP1338 /ASSEMBLY_ACC=CAM_ASM_000754 /LENGTH=361 /DNA_ID=CAMNT_0043196057 /DNA_START=81 /DNA_END=1166 /DNA_ORIENTATION=+